MSEQPGQRDAPEPEQPPDDGSVIAQVTAHAEATVTHPDGSED
jgi:hypothetical protein